MDGGRTCKSLQLAAAIAALPWKNQIEGNRAQDKTTPYRPNYSAGFVSLSLSLSLSLPFFVGRDTTPARRRRGVTQMRQPPSALRFFFLALVCCCSFFFGFFFLSQSGNTAHKHRSGCAGRRSQVSKACWRNLSSSGRGEDARSSLPKKKSKKQRGESATIKLKFSWNSSI
jgi:hypothetical protein